MKQCVAQMKGWSLEEITLETRIFDENSNEIASEQLKDTTFGITDCKLQGADIKDNKLILSKDLISNCGLILLDWKHRNKNKTEIIRDNDSDNKVKLPVYLNSQRTEILIELNLESGDNEINENKFYERGVAFFASTIGL